MLNQFVHCVTAQVILSLIAASDTTSVLTTRILQVLRTGDDSKEITRKLIQELGKVTPIDDHEIGDNTRTSSSGGVSRAGVIADFPLLDAVILETFR